MQQVQDQLDFNIDTPSDEELKDMFQNEFCRFKKEFMARPVVPYSKLKGSGKASPDLKQARKAQRRARRANRV